MKMMKNKWINKKTLVLTVLLIAAISLFGCSDDTGKAEEPTKTSSPASVAANTDVATNAGVVTDDAVNQNEESEEPEEETDNKEEKEKEQADKTKSKSESDKKEKKESSKKKSEKKDSQKPKTISVTIGIDCKTLYSKDPSMANKVSSNGVILGAKKITIPVNSTVLDALKSTGISYSGTNYVSKINGLSEKDYNDSSGWLYTLNGTVPMKSCDKQELKNGDTVQWRYTCDNGSDI